MENQGTIKLHDFVAKWHRHPIRNEPSHWFSGIPGIPPKCNFHKKNDHQHDQPWNHGVLDYFQRNPNFHLCFCHSCATFPHGASPTMVLPDRGVGLRGGPHQRNHQQCGTNGPQSGRNPQVWSPSSTWFDPSIFDGHPEEGNDQTWSNNGWTWAAKLSHRTS